jgi:uncharacterized protein YecE (DUF72 family)
VPSGTRAFGIPAPIRVPEPAATTIAYVTTTGYGDGVSLHIGTSGWAYTEWKPDFYPAGVAASGFLTYYATQLTACEINATHYRLQSEETVAKWAAAVPDGFRFATKAHRRLTHGREMAWDDAGRDFLKRFVASIRPLGDRFGALLLQYPPTRERDDAALADVLASLPDGLPVAIEFRHDSWRDDAVITRIADHGGTVCVSETDGRVLERLPPGPFAYVRLRSDRYTAEARDGWRALLERDATTRPIFAFAKHEGIPAGDPFGGVGLAQWLVEQRSPE